MYEEKHSLHIKDQNSWEIRTEIYLISHLLDSILIGSETSTWPGLLSGQSVHRVGRSVNIF